MRCVKSYLTVLERVYSTKDQNLDTQHLDGQRMNVEYFKSSTPMKERA